LELLKSRDQEGGCQEDGLITDWYPGGHLWSNPDAMDRETWKKFMISPDGQLGMG